MPHAHGTIPGQLLPISIRHPCISTLRRISRIRLKGHAMHITPLLKIFNKILIHNDRITGTVPDLHSRPWAFETGIIGTNESAPFLWCLANATETAGIVRIRWCTFGYRHATGSDAREDRGRGEDVWVDGCEDITHHGAWWCADDVYASWISCIFDKGVVNLLTVDYRTR